MTWDAITIDQSIEIRNAFWQVFEDNDYLSEKLKDNNIIIRHYLPHDVVNVKKYPYIAVIDYSNIDYEETFNTNELVSEEFFIQIAEKASSYDEAKKKAKLLYLNIRAMIKTSNNLGLYYINEIKFINIRNREGIEAQPRTWIYTISVKIRIDYQESILEEI